MVAFVSPLVDVDACLVLGWSPSGLAAAPSQVLHPLGANPRRYVMAQNSGAIWGHILVRVLAPITILLS